MSEIIRSKIHPELKIIHQPFPPDDPYRRRSKISLAKDQLDWKLRKILMID